MTFAVDWEVAPPRPEIDESLIEEVDNGVGSHVAADNRDGTYSLRTNKFTVAAYYVLSVTMTYNAWQDTAIAGSPFRVLITPAALDLGKTVVGPEYATGLLGGRINPLYPAVFTIFPHDRFGNAYVPSVDYSEAERGFEVSLAGPYQDDGTQHTLRHRHMMGHHQSRTYREGEETEEYLSGRNRSMRSMVFDATVILSGNSEP